MMGDRWLAVLEGVFFLFFENRDGGKRWNEFVGFLAEMCVPPLHVVLLYLRGTMLTWTLGGKSSVVGRRPMFTTMSSYYERYRENRSEE